MNIKFLTTTGLVACVAAGTWFFASGEGNGSFTPDKYSPRAQNNAAKIRNGNAEIMFNLRKNVNTGKIEKQDYILAKAAVENMVQTRATTLSWAERGPDNIGGRTRAILIDRNDVNHVFAGSVSGGLFESFDAGNNWTKVTGFTENLAISSMAQTVNGKIYIATGHAEEGISGNGDSGGYGNGVFVSSDNGTTWSQVSGTSSFNYVNEIVTDAKVADRVWLVSTTTPGLYVIENGTLQTAAAWGATGLPVSSAWTALDISPDGNVLVGAASGSGIITYVSTDGGFTWNEYSGSAAGEIPQSSIGRIEYAISKTKNSSNAYNIYATMATLGGAFRGAWMSETNGTTWYEIAPNTSTMNPNNPGTFTPFGSNNQGNYDNILTVHYNNPGRIFFGGIDIHEWNQGTSNPPFGQWEQRTLWFSNPQSPVYAHADQHEMRYDANGWLYVGNDGGVGKTPPGSFHGQVWFPANRGYNVTQFYSLAFSKEGWVMGGTQDNGTLLNDGTGLTALEFNEARGGDGFDCDISFIESDIMFASIYNGDMQRSNDRGFTWSPFYSNALSAIATSAGFYTVGRLYENPDDVNSGDSIIYIPSKDYGPGDTLLNLFSATAQIPITYVLGAGQTLCYEDTLENDGFYVNGTDTTYFALHPCSPGDTIWMGGNSMKFDIALDTIKIQDKIQSWYAIGLTGTNGVWITRQALRFNVSPDWYQVMGGSNSADGSGMSTTKSIEFSADGNHMYVGTWGGELWRVSGLASIYASDPDAVGKSEVGSGTRTLTTTRIYKGNSSAAITGIAVDPNNPGHVAFTVGGYGVSTHVYETFTADVDAATTGIGSFTSIQGDLPDMPAFDIVIDRDNDNQIIIGTEFGVYVTDNANGASTTWTNSSGDFGNVPVFAVRQQWRGWNDGAKNPGMIYIATHGRGIWESATLLSTPDQVQHSKFNDFVSNVTVFPNPLTTDGMVRFELSQAGMVTLKISSLDGKEVLRINPGNFASGVQTVPLNVAKLASGTYILEVITGNQRDVVKFIVQ